MIGRQVEVDLEILLIEPVVAVFGRNAQRDRLAALEGDLVRRELESLRRDRHHAGLRLLRKEAEPDRGHADDDDGKDWDEKSLHRNAPGFRICWTPSVPANSRSVSSTSSTPSRPPLSASVWRPRFLKGLSLSKATGFLSPAVVGSGKAKIS